MARAKSGPKNGKAKATGAWADVAKQSAGVHVDGAGGSYLPTPMDPGTLRVKANELARTVAAHEAMKAKAAADAKVYRDALSDLHERILMLGAEVESGCKREPAQASLPSVDA